MVLIVDDIVVHGTVEEQHDDNMWKLSEIARQNDHVFNPDKCLLKADFIMFFGCLYDKNGVQPDPERLKLSELCQHLLAYTNYRNSLGW